MSSSASGYESPSFDIVTLAAAIPKHQKPTSNYHSMENMSLGHSSLGLRNVNAQSKISIPKLDSHDEETQAALILMEMLSSSSSNSPKRIEPEPEPESQEAMGKEKLDLLKRVATSGLSAIDAKGAAPEQQSQIPPSNSADDTGSDPATEPDSGLEASEDERMNEDGASGKRASSSVLLSPPPVKAGDGMALRTHGRKRKRGC